MSYKFLMLFDQYSTSYGSIKIFTTSTLDREYISDCVRAILIDSDKLIDKFAIERTSYELANFNIMKDISESDYIVIEISATEKKLLHYVISEAISNANNESISF